MGPDPNASEMEVLTLGSAPPSDAFVGMKDVFSQVRAVCEQQPGHEAVKFGDHSLSYSEVIGYAETIAGALTKRGVGAGDLVAVCMYRTELLPSVLLGVVGAGAAYVPLDPDHAKNRLNIVLEDAAPSVAIVAGESANALKDACAQTVELDALLANEPKSTVQAPGAQLDAIAYVIFTSGSTGRPKGVQVTHRNLAAFLRSMSLEPGISERDRLLALATTTFDISCLELFGPLMNGGTVVIASEKDARDPRKLMHLLNAEQISILQATPATWRMLVEADWRTPNLKALCGGEALSEPLAAELCNRSCKPFL